MELAESLSTTHIGKKVSVESRLCKNSILKIKFGCKINDKFITDCNTACKIKQVLSNMIRYDSGYLSQVK